MNNTRIRPNEEILDTDIAKLKDLYGGFVKSTRDALARALEMGEILVRVKKSAGHGNWEMWLAENVDEISTRTAQNYMRLWDRRDLLKNASDAFLVNNFSEALGLVSAAARKERAAKKKSKDPKAETGVPDSEEREEKRDLLRELGQAFVAGLENEDNAVLKLVLKRLPDWRAGLLDAARGGFGSDPIDVEIMPEDAASPELPKLLAA